MPTFTKEKKREKKTVAHFVIFSMDKTIYILRGGRMQSQHHLHTLATPYICTLKSIWSRHMQCLPISQEYFQPFTDSEKQKKS